MNFGASTLLPQQIELDNIKGIDKVGIDFVPLQ